MPGMTADKAIAMLWDAAIADHTQSSEPDGRRQAAEAAIREAFEVRDRVGAKLRYLLNGIDDPWCGESFAEEAAAIMVLAGDYRPEDCNAQALVDMECKHDARLKNAEMNLKRMLREEGLE